jgi:hypothetical protein
MTLPRSVAEVLSDHVLLEVECIDRMYLNVYVPQLQYATGLVSYIHKHLGMPVASTAALAPISEAFTTSVRAFARDQHQSSGHPVQAPGRHPTEETGAHLPLRTGRPVP